MVILNILFFIGCRKIIPVKQYKLMCMSDVCACNRANQGDGIQADEPSYTNRMECACKALSLYARACHVKMAKLPQQEQDWSIKRWRSEGLCGESRCFKLTFVPYDISNIVVSCWFYL